MGMHKHGKDSAKAKQNERYKNEHRYELNKAKIQEKIFAGKKIKSKKTPKTIDMIWDTAIRNVVSVGIVKKKLKRKRLQDES